MSNTESAEERTFRLVMEFVKKRKKGDVLKTYVMPVPGVPKQTLVFLGVEGVRDDSIMFTYPNEPAFVVVKSEEDTTHKCSFEEYVGFTERYLFCGDCGQKETQL